MKKDDLLSYEGKKVKILLKNRFIYTCIVELIKEDCIQILDKYNNQIVVSLDEISMVSRI